MWQFVSFIYSPNSKIEAINWDHWQHFVRSRPIPHCIFGHWRYLLIVLNNTRSKLRQFNCSLCSPIPHCIFGHWPYLLIVLNNTRSKFRQFNCSLCPLFRIIYIKRPSFSSVLPSNSVQINFQVVSDVWNTSYRVLVEYTEILNGPI